MAQRAELTAAKIPEAARARVLPAPKVATGMRLSKIQDLIQTVADQDSPHFLSDREPLSDIELFVAVSGESFYAPTFRVAAREPPAVGPEVRFLKGADNKVSLVFELEETPSSAVLNAEPFPIRIASLVLKWNGGQFNFGLPTLIESASAHTAGAPVFSLRAGAELGTSEVELLSAAVGNPQSGAHLEIVYSFGYWLDTVPVLQPPIELPPQPIPGPLWPRPRPRPFPREDDPLPRPRPFPHGNDPLPHPRPDRPPLRGPVLDVLRPTLPRRPAPAESTGRRPAGPFGKILRDKGRLKEAVEEALKRKGVASYKTRTVTRSIPFTFDPNLEQNRLIFAAIRGADSISEAWVDTEFGPIRRAAYPNTVYSLPSEVRLAYNAELGTAHVVPNLYRDEHDELRVRAVLRAVPFFDPERSLALRDHLFRSSAGSLASPQIIAGGYQQATLRLLTAFPEQIKTLNEADLAIDLSGGVDLMLDLSLEYYKFVAELLTGPVGLVGEVRVLLQETPAAEGRAPVRLDRTIPVRLRLGSLANFPVEVAVEEDAVRPDLITIRNESGGVLQIGGCLPRLLQVDSNSVVPLDVFDGETDTTFPQQLEASASLAVKIRPRGDAESLLWNAVEVNLTRMKLTQTPAQSLERIHELAPSGALSWKLAVECPLFLRLPVPEQYANLFRIEVQIIRTGFTTQQVVLGRDKASVEVTMQRTLKDLFTEGSGQFTFQYRVRNVYFDHLGSWSAEKPGEGSNHFVFPNSLAND